MTTPNIRKPGLLTAAAAALATGAAVYALTRRKLPELSTVPHVDLHRYAGLWYEIARLPQRYERRCTNVTAEYRPLPDGRLEVKNTCRKNSVYGPAEDVHGVARVVDTATNAKLKVQFQWPFEGDYWILTLDPEYQFALVGTPNRKALWILARKPHLALPTLHNLVEVARQKGFPVGKLIYTEQLEANQL
ncbi:lipocalin family protein [Hymenobacter oligotrophus]|nr:lipocalin family protein [Hymenobacter oligotrophus]